MTEKSIETIVAKAEAHDCIERFCKEIRSEVETAVSIGCEAKIKAWNIARKCFERGNDSDIRVLVDIHNAKKKLENKGGSPKKAHRYLIDKLVEKGWISKATSTRWISGWMEAAAFANLEPDCAEDQFMLTVSMNLVKDLESKEKDEDDSPKAENLDEKARAFATRVASFCEVKLPDGSTRFSIPRFNAVIKNLSPLIERAGMQIMKSKKGIELNEDE